jgi:hypothetical protein
MALAKTLADLFRIRAHNRDYLESINGNLGTALGFKHRTHEGKTDEPAVIVFVPEKIHRKWISPDLLIASELKAPGGLKCPLDVVAGGKADAESSIPESGTALAQRLRGWDEKIWCGSQISSSTATSLSCGTLGAFVKRKQDGIIGFITNDHVAVGTTVSHPWAPGGPVFKHGTKLIGAKEVSILERDPVTWYGPFAKEANGNNAAVRVDCSFVSTLLRRSDVCPEPLLDSSTLPQGPWGPVLKAELEKDMLEHRLIGETVYRVGRTTGLRKGTIAAFAYEWQDLPGQKRYADFLIAGETVALATGLEISVPFSFKGDSGSVVFTMRDGKRMPVALLWGGYQEQLRGGDSQENWSYASRLDKILDDMGLSLITDVNDFPA